MFQRLILYSSTVAAEYSYTAFKEEFTVSLKGDDIPEASEISKICTAYAADLVIKQVKLAKSVFYNIFHYENGVTVVTFKDKEYIVSEELASNTGMPEFRQNYSDTEKLISYWENNVHYALVPTADTCLTVKEVTAVVIIFIKLNST